MRKLALIVAVLIGLAIGYLAGCRSHVPAHMITPGPHEGQVWRDREGHERVVRCVTQGRVYWHHPGARGADRSCAVKTWNAWVRGKGAVAER